MPDIKSILASEIRRLAKKEVKTALQPLQGQILALKKTISAQNAKIKALEKCRPATPKNKTEITPVTDKQVRLTPERIIKLRQKLGLTQGQFATLLDSNTFSVSHWENGKATPRDVFKRKIAALRGLGKRKLSKLLADKSAVSTPAPATPAPAAPTKAKPAQAKAKVKVKAAPKAEVKAKAKTKVKASPKAEAKAKVKAAPKAEVKAKAKVAPKTDVKPVEAAPKKGPRKGAKAAAEKTEKTAPVKTKIVSPKTERKPRKNAKKQDVTTAPISAPTEAPAVPNVAKTESEPEKQ